MTQQPESATHIETNKSQEESRAIDKPPDKRKPAPVGDRDGQKFHNNDGVIERGILIKSDASDASHWKPLRVAAAILGERPAAVLANARKHKLANRRTSTSASGVAR